MKKVTLSNQEDYEDPASGRSTSGSDMFEDATDQHSPQKPLPYLMDESVFISPDLHEFLLSSLPNIVKGCQWALLYRWAYIHYTKSSFLLLYLGLDLISVLWNEGQYVETWYITAYTSSQECWTFWPLFAGMLMSMVQWDLLHGDTSMRFASLHGIQLFTNNGS